MVGKIRNIGVWIVLGAVLLVGINLLAMSYVDVGVSVDVEKGVYLSEYDVTDIPQSIVDDATRMAAELYGDYKGKYEDFASQLVATYWEARDKDVILFFNAGGWGWKSVDDSVGWSSIFTGIKSELDDMGYDSLMLSYKRTGENWLGRVNEILEGITRYPSKSENLACRVEFLTEHIPEVRVIIAGESSGTVMADSTMNVLQYNPQVYSIQTGHPFWYESTSLDRKLVLNYNGLCPDVLTEGDVPLMLWETIKSAFGHSLPEEARGNIMGFIRAPGHDYRWEDPNVCSQITDFIENNFEPAE